MDSRVLAEAHDAASHCGTGHSQLPAALDDGHGQVATVPVVVTAEVDRDPLRRTFNAHGVPPPAWATICAGSMVTRLASRRSRSSDKSASMRPSESTISTTTGRSVKP